MIIGIEPGVSGGMALLTEGKDIYKLYSLVTKRNTILKNFLTDLVRSIVPPILKKFIAHPAKA